MKRTGQRLWRASIVALAWLVGPIRFAWSQESAEVRDEFPDAGAPDETSPDEMTIGPPPIEREAEFVSEDVSVVEPDVAPPSLPSITQQSDTAAGSSGRRTRDYNQPDPDRGWMHFSRAAASISTANYLVWEYNALVGEDWAYVTRENLKANLSGGFTFDGNKLPTNFFSHPYHGSAYFNLARASGLSFWESVPFVFYGSASWELLGETEAPSTNDLFATTLGGVVLGEILYRLSSEILDDSSRGIERWLREFAAGLVSPAREIERMLDGRAFETGPAPRQRHVLHSALNLGVDRIRLLSDRDVESYDPQLLVAFQLEYGDLIPDDSSQVFEPFDAFDLYTALNIGTTEQVGAQIYARGLLVGFSSDLSEDEGELRDNNVFGLVQSFDFRGAQVAQFGGLGLGPQDILVIRYGRGQRLRIGTDIQWLVLGGSSSPLDGDRTRGYNFLTGITTGQELRLDMAVWGELGIYAKQYAGVVVDGEPGQEFIGHTRLWYEIDLVSNLGVGVSPSVVHRISQFDSVGRISRAQLETQVYVRAHF